MYMDNSLLDEPRVIATFSTGPNINPRGVACIGADEAWVSGDDKFVWRFNIEGSTQGSATCKNRPDDIKVTGEGELIYSNYEDGTVNIVTGGRSKTLLTAESVWKPKGFCCTMSGGILVHMYDQRIQNKVVCFQGQEVVREIDIDEHEKPIYGSGRGYLFVVENNNENICVSDMNADAVVVTTKEGTFRFRYNGTEARREKPFQPRLIVTDSMGQIIVADINNDCLHILRQDGKFLACVDNCGLEKPCGLSVDSKGRLWVGLYEARKLKVIQYMQ